MQLPNDFHFTQGSLQDFVDCRRRFLLRYVQRLAWPAVPSAPEFEHGNEHALLQGSRFHRLVHQHLLGLPAERLSAQDMDADLRRWWDNYLEWRQNPLDLAELWQPGARQFPELTLSGELGAAISPQETGGGTKIPARFLAKYDLVVTLPDERFVILDWKTSPHPPAPARLAERMQTRLYRWLMVQAGAALLSGGSVLLAPAAEQIELIYWYAEQPAQLQRFPYSFGQHQEDQARLEQLVALIQRLESPEDFPLTSDERRCGFCVYRSLCGRGAAAGELLPEAGEEDPSGWLPELDFDQVQEIEF